jgi:hypothetical protein
MFSLFSKQTKLNYEKVLTELEILKTKNKVLYDFKRKQQKRRKHFKENLLLIENYIQLITENKEVDVNALNEHLLKFHSDTEKPYSVAI